MAAADPSRSVFGRTMLALLKDQFGNYVIQKMIDVAEHAQRKALLGKLRPHLNNLKRYTFGEWSSGGLSSAGIGRGRVRYDEVMTGDWLEGRNGVSRGREMKWH